MVRKTMMKGLMSVSFFLLALTGDLSVGVQIRTDSPKTNGLHHVLVTTHGDDLGHCGGALIREEWVLTALYCYRKKLEVILGLHPGLNRERKKVTDVQYYIKNSNKIHNIMLLKIKRSTTVTKFAKLPTAANCQLATGSVLKFYGWINPVYNFNTDQDDPQNLQTGELTLSPCQNVPKREKQPLLVYLQHHDHIILCAKHPPRVTDCELFAGTSLMQSDILYGVLVNYDILCQKQVEFMDVCFYRGWIDHVMLNSNNNNNNNNNNIFKCCGK